MKLFRQQPDDRKVLQKTIDQLLKKPVPDRTQKEIELLLRSNIKRMERKAQGYSTGLTDSSYYESDVWRYQTYLAPQHKVSLTLLSILNKTTDTALTQMWKEMDELVMNWQKSDEIDTRPDEFAFKNTLKLVKIVREFDATRAIADRSYISSAAPSSKK